MYKSLTKQDIQNLLKVPLNYKVDGLIVAGVNPKRKEYRYLYNALNRLFPGYKKEEKIKDRFFSDIRSFKIGSKRIWFDVVYGAAYLSEVVHIACMLGSRANILLGTCGGLLKEMKTGQIVLPKMSYSNESATRMYQRDNESFIYSANKNLRLKIRKQLNPENPIYEGNLMTVQAMLGETKEDVKNWAANGYCGVDMESATFFAVSGHFKVPSAALLYVADNLVKRELVTDEHYQELRKDRLKTKRENYKIALEVILRKI
jgi:purine-nucleoside phosphorylase